MQPPMQPTCSRHAAAMHLLGRGLGKKNNDNDDEDHEQHNKNEGVEEKFSGCTFYCDTQFTGQQENRVIISQQ